MAYRTSALPNSLRPRPRLVTPRVARLMGMRGLGDYTAIDTTSGARVSYGGNAPGTTTTAAAAYPDGTILSGDNNTYIVVDGETHVFPDWNTYQVTTFNGYRVAESPLVVASAKQLSAIPVGTPVPEGGTNYGMSPDTVAPVSTVAATPTTTSAAGTISSVLQPGAVYNSTTGYYTNPDGSIYYPGAVGGNYVSTAPTYSATLEQGAVYNPTTGMYTNPDGTVYNPSLASSSTAIDWTSPSTWPIWVWLALAGGTWLVFLRRR